MATVLQNLRGWTIVTPFSLVLSDLSTYFGWYYITANTNTESVGMSGIWNNQSVYIQCWQGAAAMGDLPNCWMLLQKLRTRTLEHQRSKELFGIYGKITEKMRPNTSASFSTASHQHPKECLYQYHMISIIAISVFHVYFIGSKFRRLARIPLSISQVSNFQEPLRHCIHDT